MSKTEFTFEKLKPMAERLGVKKWAFQKWRQRGVPAAWRYKLMQEYPGVFRSSDFDLLPSKANQPDMN